MLTRLVRLTVAEQERLPWVAAEPILAPQAQRDE